ncbi:MAG: DUF7662 domain-containing protein [Candidatus Bathyarchaeales archaeon]
MGKYTALAEYLRSQQQREITLSFKQIENILGFELPISARKHRCWWANDESHVQAREGWMSVGWCVKSASLTEEIVSFIFRPEIKLLESKQYRRHSFRDLAREVMSRLFGVNLAPRKLLSWPKLFDMASPDGAIVGEAVFFAASNGKTKLLPGRLTYITERVWLLEKTSAKTKFLVFGGDPEAPREWLKKYGKFASEIKFYAIAGNEAIRLN